MISGELIWFQERGYGYVHPVEVCAYDREYNDKYVELSRLRMSDTLMLSRENMVRRHWQGDIVDIGSGAGTFVEHMRRVGYPRTKGYDVNPWAVQWLTNSGLWRNPWLDPEPEAATFWDTLEHMVDPEAMIHRIRTWAFVCLPVFKDMEHARHSKHYRPNEHLWYFTERGLIGLFAGCGFECVERNGKENDAGRSGIGSYAFRKVDTPE